MENKTGFDLNDAIAEWRKGMAGEDALGAEALRELESHLREAVRELAGKGLSEEEAFLVARRRLGGREEIGKEFAAANPEGIWRKWLFHIVLVSVFTYLFAEFYFVLSEVFGKWQIVRALVSGDMPWLLVFAGGSAILVSREIVRRINSGNRTDVTVRRKLGKIVCGGILALKGFNIFLFPLLFMVMRVISGSDPVRGEAAPPGVIAAYVVRQCIWILLAVAVGLFVVRFAPNQKEKQTA